MRLRLLVSWSVLLLLGGWPAAARATDVGIITGSEITGSEKGTYYQFGLNVQSLVRPKVVRVTAHPSKGSIENVYPVYQRPGVQLEIV